MPSKLRASRDRGGNRRFSKILPRRPSISKKRRESVNKDTKPVRKSVAPTKGSTNPMSDLERSTKETSNRAKKDGGSGNNPAEFDNLMDGDNNQVDEGNIVKLKKEWLDGILKGGLEPLWEQYREIVRDTGDVSTSAAFDANPSKNRYTNVKCWDTTRVVLSGLPGSCDYIHANFVDGYKKEKEFILTQGPMKGTIEDFWHMMWSENCVTIVMLCQKVEDNKEKCETYWADDTNEKTMRTGPFEITTCSKTSKTLPDDQKVDVYELEVHKDKEPIERRIVHYNYKTWPDKGIPRTETVLMQFYHKVRLVQRSGEKQNSLGHSPIVIHCSAGIGRSGCFAALAICYNRLEATGKVDVGAIVKTLRRQRALSIQNGMQYLYLHLALVAFIGGQIQVDFGQFKQMFNEKFEKPAVKTD